MPQCHGSPPLVQLFCPPTEFPLVRVDDDTRQCLPFDHGFVLSLAVEPLLFWNGDWLEQKSTSTRKN
jgi:hypothetical protein